jgi:O-antigen ligase
MKLLTAMRHAFDNPDEGIAWKIAFLAALLLPWMLIFDRTGAEICCALIGLTFLWRSAATRNWGWLRDPFTMLCALAWAWLLLVVTPLALDPGNSLAPAAAWIRIPILFIALRYWVLAKPDKLYTACIVIAGMLSLVMVDTLWQYMTGLSLSGNSVGQDERLTGPMDAPKVGLFIGKLVVAAAVVGWATTPRIRRFSWVRWGLLVLAGVATIMLAGERSAFLAAMLAIAVGMGLLVVMERRFRLPCIGLGLAGMALCIGVYLTNDFVRERAKFAARTITHYSKSDYGQLVQVGYNIGRENMLHGVGLKGFRKLCPELDHYGVLFRGVHPHNVYIEWFAEAGLPGLVLCVAIIVTLLGMAGCVFWRSSGRGRIVPAIACGVVLQHFFPLMGMQSFFTNWSALLVWYSMGLIFAALPPKHPATR